MWFWMALEAHCQNSAAVTEADIATWTFTVAVCQILSHNNATNVFLASFPEEKHYN